MTLIDKQGRQGNTYVTVKDVPVYQCNCGIDFLDNADSVNFTNRVKESAEAGLSVIDYKKKIKIYEGG